MRIVKVTLSIAFYDADRHYKKDIEEALFYAVQKSQDMGIGIISDIQALTVNSISDAVYINYPDPDLTNIDDPKTGKQVYAWARRAIKEMKTERG